MIDGRGPVDGKVSEMPDSPWANEDSNLPEPQSPEPWPGFRAGMPPPPPSAGGNAGRTRSVPSEPSRRRRTRWIVPAALVLLLGLVGSASAIGGLVSGTRTVAPERRSVGSAPIEGTASAATIARAVAPAIVDINTYARRFGAGRLVGGGTIVPLGAGTGMILTSSGQVLTNNHVVEGAVRIQVTIPGHSGTFAATVVGTDPTDDVALLQIQGVSGLPTVTPGDSSSLRVGQRVIAIGNAFGRGGAPAVTQGTVTGLHRSITATDPVGGSEHLTDVIQTNAVIRPGDSGGALVDTSGRVIGMITAGASGGAFSGTSPGVGFAIPVEGALHIVEEIRAGHGSSTILLGERGFLGIAVRPLDQATAARLGLSTSSGALVVGVLSGSPAADAGIVPPAVIVSVDGRPIDSTDALGTAIHAHVPGDQVSVTWIDRTGIHSATVGLISGPAV